MIFNGLITLGNTITAQSNLQVQGGAVFEGDVRFDPEEIASASTISPDTNDAHIFHVAVDTNMTVNAIANPLDGASYYFRFKQGSTGGTLTFNSKYKFPGGTAPTASSGSGKVDTMCCVYHATDDRFEANFLADHS